MNIDAHRDFGDRECPSCATRVPANHNRCPLCGYEFPHASGRGRWRLIALLLLILLLAVLFGWGR
jgi:predicted amidophosphoribosyltransferase